MVTTALPEAGSFVFPGTYTTHFEPALTLTIDRQVQIDCAPGYRCRGDVDINSPRWLDIEFGRDHPMDISIIRVDKVFDPKHPGKLLDPPADLVGWISGFPHVKVLVSTPIRVGGADATQLDVQSGDHAVSLGPSGLADPASFGFDRFQLRRIDVFRVGGAAIMVMIAPVNDVDNTTGRLAAATDILQPIVESITWQ